MMFGYDHDMNGWGYAAMGIGMVLFWALIIIGIVALIRAANLTPQARVIHQPPAPIADSPEQMLATRFARGEIDETEYQQRLTVLRSHAPR